MEPQKKVNHEIRKKERKVMWIKKGDFVELTAKDNVFFDGIIHDIVVLNYPTRPGRMGIPMGCPTSLVQLMSIP